MTHRFLIHSHDINTNLMKQPFFSFIDLNHNRFRVPHLMLHVWKLRVCYDLGTHWKIVQDRWQRGRIPFHGFLMSYWNCRTALGIENFLVIILLKRVYRKLSNEWPMILPCNIANCDGFGPHSRKSIFCAFM